MKKFSCILLTALLVSLTAFSSDFFSRHFENATLRLDYVFSGNDTSQHISFMQAYKTNIWAGRRTNLQKPLLAGNGQICIKDAATGEVLYTNSFSTLFQEWQNTEEATKVTRGFENCFQVPWPKKPVIITVTLTDKYQQVSASLSHSIDPEDILIRPLKSKNSYRQIHGGGNYESRIDVAIIGDGYSARDQQKFHSDALRAVTAIMNHEPFKSMENRFNFIAVSSISRDSGVSIPHADKWKDTSFSSHYDTFYSKRYLTTSSMRSLYHQLAGIPFEHIIVLANTGEYGGGGIYNSLVIASSDHPTFEVVLVHEFGHGFGGLADEYYYDDEYSLMYPSGVEPWEPNITTLTDFGSKWKDMLSPGTFIPTPPDSIERNFDVRRIWNTLSKEEKASLNNKIGVYEGGGYQSKGVFRPVQECRMKINECENFCPVCSRAIVRMVDYYTAE